MSEPRVHLGGVRLPMLRLPLPRRVGLLHYSVTHFLGVLVVLLVISPFVEDLAHGDLIELVLVTAVLLSAVLAIGARRRTLVLAMALVTPAITARWVDRLLPGAAPPEIFLIAALLFLAFVVLHLFGYILRAPRVNSEVLSAGVATYIMLAFLWSQAYALVDRLQPGAFTFTQSSDAGRPMQGFTALYFSFVTLSTVGYGDIVPASNAVRMLAMLEAATGVFYVAILVARLVSLYSAADLVAIEHPASLAPPAQGGEPTARSGAPENLAGARTTGEQQPTGAPPRA